MSQKIIDQLQANLLDRAKASSGNVLIEDSSYQTSNYQRFPVKNYFITFGSNSKAQQSMRVRWIARPIESGGNWIYQVSVLHTNTKISDIKALLSQEGYANFFNEFRPE